MNLTRFQAVEKVNNLFVYQYDTEQYNAADYWRVLDVDAEKDEGDCEDYALTVAWLLAGRSRLKFLKMLFKKEFQICFISTSVGGHAILKHGDLYVDNWKRKWTTKNEYEKDYANYEWTFKFAYKPLVVIKKLIQGKFWKK